MPSIPPARVQQQTCNLRYHQYPILSPCAPNPREYLHQLTEKVHFFFFFYKKQYFTKKNKSLTKQFLQGIIKRWPKITNNRTKND